MGFIRLINE